MMKLIADSGGTKTDWTLLYSPYPGQWDIIESFQTQGITPIHQKPDVIRQILAQEMMSRLSTFPRAALVNTNVLEGSLLSKIEVFFYGSGCTPAHVPMMKQIACILGTGSNSCLYDGNDIVQNTPALGYILGDEGGGAVLGRLFMNAIFKNPAFQSVRDEYLKENKLTQADIINKVYREPLANRFLATTSLFIGKHIDNPLLSGLVEQNFRQFFRSNIVPYNRPDLPVHFIGSMASYYHQQLAQAAQAEGFQLGKVMKSPMEGLITYHGA